MKGATISCNVMIGGHSVVMDNAVVGLGTVIHQHRCIGSYCMVGMGSVVTKSIRPFMKAYGSPCRVMGINEVGMLRGPFDKDDIETLRRCSWDKLPPKFMISVKLWETMEGGTSGVRSEEPKEEDIRQ